jgi:putative NIF3 family GTP cyclohydrolase 1 type 2
VDAVVRSICAAHPYESPSIDIYAVQQAATRQGYGVVGRLDVPEALPDFLARVATRLGAGALRYVGRDDAEIRTVAVCGGSGMSFLGAALRAGADAYVTADITYHRFFEALAPDGAPRLALIDAGHYETEAITEHLLADHLRATVEGLETVVTRTRTSPMRTFVPTSAPAPTG